MTVEEDYPACRHGHLPGADIWLAGLGVPGGGAAHIYTLRAVRQEGVARAAAQAAVHRAQSTNILVNSNILPKCTTIVSCAS
jgi:hypothetical protein